jgi:hypothetical protein
MDNYINRLFKYLWIILSSFAIIIVLIIWQLKGACLNQLLVLFLSLEGTAFLSSSFSPSICELAYNGKVKDFIINCFKYKTSVSFNPIMFFLGIIMLFISYSVGMFIN